MFFCCCCFVLFFFYCCYCSNRDVSRYFQANRDTKMRTIMNCSQHLFLERSFLFQLSLTPCKVQNVTVASQIGIFLPDPTGTQEGQTPTVKSTKGCATTKLEQCSQHHAAARKQAKAFPSLSVQRLPDQQALDLCSVLSRVTGCPHYPPSTVTMLLGDIDATRFISLLIT